MKVADVVALLISRRETVAVAESLTGGLLAAEFVTVPGTSAVFPGGVVAYEPRVKSAVLGVDPDLIGRYGVVSGETAAALATGVRDVMGATWGLGTTGVAGPEAHGGRAPGTVWLGVAGPDGFVRTESHMFAGSRPRVRRHAVDAALILLSRELVARTRPGAC